MPSHNIARVIVLVLTVIFVLLAWGVANAHHGKQHYDRQPITSMNGIMFYEREWPTYFFWNGYFVER